MSQGVIGVSLNRDGQSTPWGFRLHGGKDIGYPLTIQRVFLGSPSEGELQRGDIILQIGNREASELTHMEAHDIIKSAGNQLRLLVHRLPGAPQSPGAFSPASPASMKTIHPLANFKSTPSPFTASSFQPMLPPKANAIPQSTPKPWGTKSQEYVLSPLPTTPGLDHPLSGGLFTPSPQNTRLSEVQEYNIEKEREKKAITHQGYRTIPLILPQPKTRHDVPIGSYLRHVHDSSWKGRAAAPQPKPYFMNQPTQTYSHPKVDAVNRGFNMSSVPRPVDDGPQLVHLQYNSPLHLYSKEAVEETIQEQTGLQPRSKPATPAPGLKTTFNPAPLSPVPAGGNLTPAKPGTKLTNIVDITRSPTFQMIHETETRSASPRPEMPTSPVFVRSPAAAAAVGNPKACGFEQNRVNTFGVPRDAIHQSGSFKTLMATLALTGQQEF